VAAWGGHLAVLQWAREHHCPWYKQACDLFTECGHFLLTFEPQCALILNSCYNI